jgi:hypothetical protein
LELPDIKKNPYASQVTDLWHFDGLVIMLSDVKPFFTVLPFCRYGAVTDVKRTGTNLP